MKNFKIKSYPKTPVNLNTHVIHEIEFFKINR